MLGDGLSLGIAMAFEEYKRLVLAETMRFEMLEHSELDVRQQVCFRIMPVNKLSDLYALVIFSL